MEPSVNYIQLRYIELQTDGKKGYNSWPSTNGFEKARNMKQAQ